MTNQKNEGHTTRSVGSSSPWRIAPSGGWSSASERKGSTPENQAEVPASIVFPAFDVDLDDLEPEIDGRTTVLFLRAVSGTLEQPDAEPPRPELERVERLLSDAALSADEAARFEHRRLVVAPLLMLLALGLLVGAGWSC